MDIARCSRVLAYIDFVSVYSYEAATDGAGGGGGGTKELAQTRSDRPNADGWLGEKKPAREWDGHGGHVPPKRMRGNRSDAVRRRAYTRVHVYLLGDAMGSDRKRLSTSPPVMTKCGETGGLQACSDVNYETGQDRGGIRARRSTRLDADDSARLKGRYRPGNVNGNMVFSFLPPSVCSSNFLFFFFFYTFNGPRRTRSVEWSAIITTAERERHNREP